MFSQVQKDLYERSRVLSFIVIYRCIARFKQPKIVSILLFTLRSHLKQLWNRNKKRRTVKFKKNSPISQLQQSSKIAKILNSGNSGKIKNKRRQFLILQKFGASNSAKKWMFRTKTVWGTVKITSVQTVCLNSFICMSN